MRWFRAFGLFPLLRSHSTERGQTYLIRVLFQSTEIISFPSVGKMNINEFSGESYIVYLGKFNLKYWVLLSQSDGMNDIKSKQLFLKWENKSFACISLIQIKWKFYLLYLFKENGKFIKEIWINWNASESLAFLSIEMHWNALNCIIHVIAFCCFF